ncbi:uncharacterized protein DEA37_0006489 [Paragonimus westermani]|uniref:Negative elongation factor B n=1 Tax=Paragonimus westermani TaxID=34504 RepID=A0A5J4NQ46_9TREM|nr:uncharacterized protein DEA37_0006489 [Paragonimus westermani]
MVGDGQTLYDKTVNIIRDQCARLEKTAMSMVLGSTTARDTSKEPIMSPPKRRRRLNSSESSTEERSRSLESHSPSATTFIPLAFLPNQSALASVVLSTIRFDLLMSLNEAKIDRLCVPDRIHRFVWCLDACVRNRRIDQRHASGLAYHLTVQRQRAKKMDAHTEDQARDSADDGGSRQDSSSKRGISTGRLKAGKSTLCSSTKALTKKMDVEQDQSDEETNESEKYTESSLFERDIHLACRDPWVLYTICTSLIRYTLNGIYEDKLPRDIPEVSLLVHFLLLGLGEDFQTPCYDSSNGREKDRLGSKRSFQIAETMVEDLTITACASKALVGHILPAIAQLQVLIWRAQVAEEILGSCSQIWPGTACSGSATGTRRGSVGSAQDAREGDLPPAALQKQIASDASNSTAVNIPTDYFVHPIGYLILQYHALFALERNELAVLRALLKAIANVTQQQLRANRLASKAVPNKQGPSSPPTSPSGTAGVQIQFRWRPEILQASDIVNIISLRIYLSFFIRTLVLGLVRLPPTAPAFVDNTRAGSLARSVGSSTFNDNSVQMDNGSEATDMSNLELTVSSGVSSNTTDSLSTTRPGVKSGSATIGQGVGSGVSEMRSTPGRVLITRAELASFLRASLVLVNDLQLLALAQLALMVPGPGNLGAASHLLPAAETSQVEIPSPTSLSMSERERWTHTLARHCVSVSSIVSDITPTTTTTPAGQETETTHSLPLTPTNLSGSRSGAQNQLTPLLSSMNTGTSVNRGFQIPFQPDSTWAGATPRSPTSATKTARVVSSYFPTTTSLDFQGYANTPACPFYSISCASIGASHLPIGTPLTNPGLMRGTPNLNSMALGQNVVIPPTPRRPSTPPREFRPSSPISTITSLTHSSSRISAFNMPSHSCNTEFNSPCPSPSVHRSANGSVCQAPVYPRPRSPSPTSD